MCVAASATCNTLWTFLNHVYLHGKMNGQMSIVADMDVRDFHQDPYRLFCPRLRCGASPLLQGHGQI